MRKDTYVKQATMLVIALSCIALSTIGGADNALDRRKPPSIADEELFFAPVPKAVCGPGDRPETALQGQVPAAMRAAGFQGFNCNLQLIGQVRGEGANWQTDEWREGRGRNRKVCAYHGTAAPTAFTPVPRANYGVRVIDISDPTKPYTTAYLNSISMLDPWESLKVNKRRQVLGAVNGANGAGGPEFDLYDVSGDCRYPQLLFSGPIGLGADEPVNFGVIGHEGNFAPDGLTYYGGGRTVPNNYYAIDITNLTKPKLIAQWNNPRIAAGGRTHGLSVSDDGRRGYFVSTLTATPVSLADPTSVAANGLVIYDLTEIQERRPNAQAKVIGEVYWKDGATAQHTIHVKIKHKPYVIFVDEAGSGGIGTANLAAACAFGQIPFPLARIIDISDERNPRIISKLMLETHDPANCDKVLPDLVGQNVFTYGSHYCSVDNKHNATTLACGYFNSGIRVFDIRDPIRPREIAYYNPAGTTTASPGSNHVSFSSWVAGGPDWCNAQVPLDAEQGTLWTTCQDNGLLSLKFTHNAWPFAESRTPPGMQN